MAKRNSEFASIQLNLELQKEINALRRERDRQRDRMEEMQAVIDSLTMQLKSKEEIIYSIARIVPDNIEPCCELIEKVYVKLYDDIPF